MGLGLTKDWTQLAARARYNSRNLATLREITPRQLQRIFQNQIGRTPQDWLNEQRIFAAQQLLQAGTPVKRVAIELGFKQPSHFCRQFKSLSGITPGKFKSTGIGASNVAIR